ncbi:MAG: EpsG family protein [Treponema sp.]|nr:EpsG family protein [Treponema sp.]
MIYFVFWGLLYLGAVVDSGTDKKLTPKNCFIFYSLIFTYFLVLAGFRYKTGYDWQNYMPFFENINNPTMFKKMDVGYAWLNYFFKNVFNSYSVMIFVVALFCTCVLFKFNKTYSSYPMMSLFIYGATLFLPYNMGLYRQSIAMTLSLIVFHFIVTRKYCYAILLFLLSMTFHISAIITLFYFICVQIHFTKNQRITILLLIIFLNLRGISIVTSIFTFFFSLPIIPSSISHYGNYLFTGLGKQVQFSSGLGYLLRMILYIIIFLNKENNTRVTNSIFNLILFGCFINSFARHIQIIERLEKYFTIYEMIFYVYMIDVFKKYLRSNIRILFTMFFCLYFFLVPRGFVIGNNSVDGKPTWIRFYPWHSTIFKIEENERNAVMKSVF